MATSACGVSVSESVLLAELGSDAPGPGVTVAVLTSTPTASDATVAVTVNVTVAATGTFTVALMLPVPDGVPQAPPPAPAHVQVALESAAGRVSITVAPIALLGPALVTVIVYVTVEPGTIVVTPLVLDIPRSVIGAVIAVVAIAVLLPAAGSGVDALDTVAVLVIGSGVVWPGGTANVAMMATGAAPAAIVPSEHGNPPLHAPLAETNVSPAGGGSVTGTLNASDGPAVVTVIGDATGDPGVAFDGPLFDTCRSATGATVTALVALLFSAFGSVTPAGAVIEAVLARTPSVLDAIVPAAVNVADCPACRSTVAAMFPAPEAEPHAD